MKTFFIFVTVFLVGGCTTPINQLSQQTLDARVAVHAAAYAQAKETLQEARDWQTLGVQITPLPAPPAVQVAPLAAMPILGPRPTVPSIPALSAAPANASP